MYIKDTSLHTCGHCGLRGLLKSLSGYCERGLETIKSPCGYLVREYLQPWGVAYELSLCTSCGEVTLTKVVWHDDWKPQDYSYFILYPPEGKK